MKKRLSRRALLSLAPAVLRARRQHRHFGIDSWRPAAR
jgi:hypothetical protein